MKQFITPKSLKQRCLKRWQRGDFHRACLQPTNLFPLEIPLKSISAKHLLTHFKEVQDAIYSLRQDSKKHGYSIIDKVITHRQLGEQKIPATLVFKTETIFLNYLSKSAESNQFKTLVQQTLEQEGLLKDWLIQFPFKLMKYADDWLQLLNICCYFKNHPRPDCYIRQLDIKGVDSKFIEQHKGILNELLSQILTKENYNADITGLSHHGFERRYGLRYDLPLIRIRILDESLAIQGLTDLTLTVDEFKQLNVAAKTVFIAENKINGLAFPDFPKAIVIFGLGYAVNLLADAPCLENRKLFYWGDIDTHGFAILSRLRHYYPKVKSLLMDQQTLDKFIDLSVYETLEKSEQNPLSYLTDEENSLYKELQNNLRRLEQERISFVYLELALKKLS
ncbi:MAG: DUF2220 family protein [Methylococcales bacterium]